MSRSSPRPSRLRPTHGVALLVTVGLATGGGLVSDPSPADAQSQQKLERLRDEIGKTRSKVESRKRRERVLTSDVRRYSARIGGLQSQIDELQAKQAAVQEDLDVSQAALTTTQTNLRAERARLVRLRARLKVAREVLSARLLELYQADKPDLVSVVVSANGFADLVERGEFLSRIGQQDKRVMETVKSAKTEAVATEKRLAVLERGQRETNRRIEARKDEVVQVKGRLVSTRSSISEARASRKTLLKRVRGHRHELEDHLDGMEKEESKIQAKLSSMPSGGGGVKKGSGALDWPANGTFTSPFGFRWGRLHGGIDIAVPVGTPVHAAASGTVRISGWTGGYGNYICIDHGGGLSTCYGHNSRLGVRVGQKVTKGQVIAAAGNTGNSTGPHIHFETRVGGVQRDPMGYL